MTLAIISPHLDDAVFSLGEHLVRRRGATIICPFGGVPADDAGRQKYLTLIREHDKVCKTMGLRHIDGNYLDDVYASTRDMRGLTTWLCGALKMCEATEVWVPLGIHHPDHQMVATCARAAVQQLRLPQAIYEELPYRVLYPERINRTLLSTYELVGYSPALYYKKEMCRLYESQMKGDDIERCLYAPERLWLPK